MRSLHHAVENTCSQHLAHLAVPSFGHLYTLKTPESVQIGTEPKSGLIFDQIWFILNRKWFFLTKTSQYFILCRLSAHLIRFRFSLNRAFLKCLLTTYKIALVTTVIFMLPDY